MANHRQLHDAQFDPVHRFFALPHHFNSSGVAHRSRFFRLIIVVVYSDEA